MRRQRARGFTLVELMAVVTLIAVMGTIAMVSLRKSRTEGDVDAWANAIRNAATHARRRAAATGKVYTVAMTTTTVQWCEVDPVACSSNTVAACSTSPTAEIGLPIRAGVDALLDSYANTVDVSSAAGVYLAPAHTPVNVGSTIRIFFGPSGVEDGSCLVTQTTSWSSPSTVAGLTGFTAYVRASNSGIATDAQTQKHRRIIIYGATGRSRIIDTW